MSLLKGKHMHTHSKDDSVVDLCDMAYMSFKYMPVQAADGWQSSWDNSEAGLLQIRPVHGPPPVCGDRRPAVRMGICAPQRVRRCVSSVVLCDQIAAVMQS